MSNSKFPNELTRVLVTGASGYIAAHVVRILLENGYLVRGTVRSLKNETKIRPLRHLHAAATNNLELVEADLLNPHSWHAAVDGCTYVLHIASPFPNTEPSDPNLLYKPAVEGTLNVLKAVHKNGHVKRVVLTSSTAAIIGEAPDGKRRDENDWTSMGDNVSVYCKSKVLAEKVAWDFVKDHPTFELTVVNPGYVTGPLIHDSYCTSAELFIRILNGKAPMLPSCTLPVVDVRDVAKAHLRAMILPEAKGLRFCITTRTMYLVEFAEMLKKEFESQGYWISTAEAPYWAMWLYSFFDKGSRLILPNIGRYHLLDNTRMRTILDVQPTPMNQSVTDMAYSLIELGLVRKTSGYKTPKALQN